MTKTYEKMLIDSFCRSFFLFQVAISVVYALGKLEIVLNYGEYAYVSRAVRREMVTPLGLVHKFNSYLAIESVVESENEMMLKVKGEGAFAFYVEESCLITLLTVNGETRVFEIDNHLLQVELSEATSVIKLNWK